MAKNLLGWHGLEPRWRGDPTRWSVVSGTLLNVVDNCERDGSSGEQAGLFPSEMVVELRRLHEKYKDVDSGEISEMAEQLQISAPVFMNLLAALTKVEWGAGKASSVEGPLAYTSAGRVTLTDSGRDDLGRIYSAFTARIGIDLDKKSVDTHEPLLKWEPPAGWGVSEAAEAALPPQRETRARLTYRQWLTMLHKESKVYVAAQESTMTRRPAEPGTPEEVEQEAALKRRHAQIKHVRGFAKTVLSGGPESVWMGKPLFPKDVHNDVESFYAAGKPGFSKTSVEASSLAWELWETDRVALHEYAEVKEWLELRDLESRTVSDLRKGAQIDADDSSQPALYKRMVGSKAVARTEATFAAYDPLGVNGVMDYAGEGIAERIISPGNFGKINPDGTMAHTRCSFVYGASERDPGFVGHSVKAGSQCGNIAVLGTTRCEMHGGLLASPEETRSMIVSAQMKAFALSGQALTTIADIMVNGTTEAARLRAAETILNRSGIVEGAEVNINSTREANTGGSDNPARDIILDRLAAMGMVPGQNSEADEEAKRELEANTIEGSVVDDKDETG